jgi:uncharacterized protein (DUF342 family)
MKALILYFDEHVSRMFVESKDAAGAVHTVLSSHHNFTSEEELVGRIVEANDLEDAKRFVDPTYHYHKILPYSNLKTGNGIQFEESTKTFKARCYGFVILDNVNGLHVVVPFQISQDKTKAYYFVHPTNSGKLPVYKEIGDLITSRHIVTPVDQNIVIAELSKIDAQDHVTKLKVAETPNEPAHGRPEYYELLVDTTKKAGKLLENGRIDFKERDSIIQVTKGEELLKRYEEIKPVDGTDIFGNPVPAIMQKSNGYEKGDNFIQSDKNPEIFTAAIDGYLDIDKNRVEIKSILTISGDVNYERGNIDFKGSVLIQGNVDSGFSVKAAGDITVEQSVDDAQLEAAGNIDVKMGISGKGTATIKAGGSIRAKFILHSKVEAKGEIVVEDSIINSRVFSNQRVLVLGQHGKILAGETIALKRIEVNTVGSETVPNTVLSVGRNLELEHEMEAVRQEINLKKEALHAVMNKLSSSFGTLLFEDPKKYLSTLPDFRRKQCLELLSEESALNKRLKELMEDASKIEQKLVLDEEPFIVVKEKIYPGSLLNIKKSAFKVESEIPNAKFFESPEEKIIKYVPAGS